MGSESNNQWPRDLFTSMLFFVTSIIIICSGVFLLLSGNTVYSIFVISGSSVALLSSMANMCDAMMNRLKKNTSTPTDNEMTKEDAEQLGQITKDCRKMEKTGVPAG